MSIRTRGFTLIELLMVISIIGLLSSIVVVTLTNARTKSRIGASMEFESSALHGLYLDKLAEYDFSDINTGCDAAGNFYSVRDVGGNAAAELVGSGSNGACTTVILNTNPLGMKTSPNDQLAFGGSWYSTPISYGGGTSGSGLKPQSMDLTQIVNSLSSGAITTQAGSPIAGMSISIWLKCTTANVAATFLTVTGSGNTVSLQFDGANNIRSQVNGVTVLSTNALCDTTWHQFFFSYGSTPKLFADGHQVATGGALAFPSMANATIQLFGTTNANFINHPIIYSVAVP